MTHSPVQRGLILFVLSLMAAPPVWAGTPTPPSPSPERCERPYKRNILSAAALREALHAHQAWLEQRDSPGHTRANLCGVDLRKASLEGANLERARMEGADLRRANLRQSVQIGRAHV